MFFIKPCDNTGFEPRFEPKAKGAHRAKANMGITILQGVPDLIRNATLCGVFLPYIKLKIYNYFKISSQRTDCAINLFVNKINAPPDLQPAPNQQHRPQNTDKQTCTKLELKNLLIALAILSQNRISSQTFLYFNRNTFMIQSTQNYITWYF